MKIGNITKTNLIEKGISTLTIESKFLKAVKRKLSHVKFDLVLYSTPPITFEKIIKYVKKRDQAKSYLLLKDIFPQNAVDLGMFSKKNPIYWYFRAKEKKLYKTSDYIGCMSQANVDYVYNNNSYLQAKSTEIEVCPNSIELKSVNINQKKKVEIRKKYGIPTDKTIFLYGGNLGKPQGIDFLIKCLRQNEKSEGAFFVVVGSGTEFDKLKLFFGNEKPRNSLLLSYLPKDDYEVLANSCDVGLVFLDKRFTIPNFPSRILSYMNVSVPILAATDPNTDLGDVISKGRFGFWCESDNVEKFSEHVERLCDQSLRKQLGINSKKYLVENYTTEHTYNIIMQHFE
ncbi:glycosyltransferase family 4 protein [Alkalibacillus haloalkaliphilus]|uniref:glycosyltransferase family 4 protein n=1 Tax=Alkalibacillus haloalkaliphilus TaxID=94136 RepID=UPI0003034087|nr:glycosyltransferase family 4 protein [Alkalibacillus haloalkaliphilus]